MPDPSLNDDAAEARAFADSIAGVLDRHGRADSEWEPGEVAIASWPELTEALGELGWGGVARDPELVAFAGLGGVELGRRLAPLEHIDGLLGGSPLVGDLVRCLGPERVALVREDGAILARPVRRAEPLASADGLQVHRVLELGRGRGVSETPSQAWIAASVGYLAGLGEGALDLTVGYVQQRRAFGTTLAGLAPVQQLLAGAATAVRGVRLLAGERPGDEALAYAGPAVAEACAACQQVTGAIGFTLEYPLHRYTQRARALGVWNEVLLDWFSGPPSPAEAARRAG